MTSDGAGMTSGLLSRLSRRHSYSPARAYHLPPKVSCILSRSRYPVDLLSPAWMSRDVLIMGYYLYACPSPQISLCSFSASVPPRGSTAPYGRADYPSSAPSFASSLTGGSSTSVSWASRSPECGSSFLFKRLSTANETRLGRKRRDNAPLDGRSLKRSLLVRRLSFSYLLDCSCAPR